MPRFLRIRECRDGRSRPVPRLSAVGALAAISAVTTTVIDTVIAPAAAGLERAGAEAVPAAGRRGLPLPRR